MDPGPFGCLGAGPGQAIGAACAHPGTADLPAARRRRLRLQRARVRHDGPPRPAGRRRDGQQRDLGAGEAPDGVPLRLLDRRRAPARDALRADRRGARRPRRAGPRAGRARARRSSARSRPASRRSSTCSPIPTSSTRAGPCSSEPSPAAAAMGLRIGRHNFGYVTYDASSDVIYAKLRRRAVGPPRADPRGARLALRRRGPLPRRRADGAARAARTGRRRLRDAAQRRAGAGRRRRVHGQVRRSVSGWA